MYQTLNRKNHTPPLKRIRQNPKKIRFLTGTTFQVQQNVNRTSFHVSKTDFPRLIAILCSQPSQTFTFDKLSLPKIYTWKPNIKHNLCDQ